MDARRTMSSPVTKRTRECRGLCDCVYVCDFVLVLAQFKPLATVTHFSCTKMQLHRPSVVSEMIVYRSAIIASYLAALVQSSLRTVSSINYRAAHTVQQARKWDDCSAERDIMSLLLEMTNTKLLISHKTTHLPATLKKHLLFKKE